MIRIWIIGVRKKAADLTDPVGVLSAFFLLSDAVLFDPFAIDNLNLIKVSQVSNHFSQHIPHHPVPSCALPISAFTGKGNLQFALFHKKYCFQKICMVEISDMAMALQKNKNTSLQGVNMKRFFLPLLLSLLFSISFALASFAEGIRTLTILYTGSVKGAIDPCPS
jgi:hypothetical protein